MNHSDKRKSRRFPVYLEGSFSFNGNSDGSCAVKDISLEGMSILLYLPEQPCTNTTLDLSLAFPVKSQTIQSMLNLAWFTPLDDHSEYNYVAGGKLISMKAEAKRSLLEFAYDSWFRTV